MNTTDLFLKTGQCVSESGHLCDVHPSSDPQGQSLQRGFTLTELMIVVAIIALLAAIAIPNFVRARTSTHVRFCITNLRKLEDSKSQWAMENAKTDTSVPATTDIIPYLKSGHMPICPENGTYRLRRIIRDPTCSLNPIGHALSNLNMDDDPSVD